MKLFVTIVMGLVMLGTIAMVVAVLWHDKRSPIVTCFVIADNAPVYNNPGREFKAVREDVHGMVNVVGRVGDWYKLVDGTYMPAYCLTPARAGEYPKELKE